MGMFGNLARVIKRRIRKSNEQSPENGRQSPEFSSEASEIEEAVTTPRNATASSIYRCAPAVAQSSLPPEVREIQEDMERDYNRSVETLKFYDKLPDPTDPAKLISAPLLHEDPEKPGKYYYLADYDGRNEIITDPADSTKRIPIHSAENFTGKKFTMPTCAEVLSWLTVDQVRLYNEMKSNGLKPKLQLSPIALNIRTMGRRIDAKRAYLTFSTDNTCILDNIKDDELVYEAESFKAIEAGKKLQITGGKSKSQWIKDNNGWAIDIVATKQNLDPDADKKTKTITVDGRTTEVELTNAEKTEKYMQEFRANGYGGLSYETYLTAQMNALRAGKPLERFDDYWPWTILPESLLHKQEIIAYGRWLGFFIHLKWIDAGEKSNGFRTRRSVRVRRLEI